LVLLGTFGNVVSLTKLLRAMAIWLGIISLVAGSRAVSFRNSHVVLHQQNQTKQNATMDQRSASCRAMGVYFDGWSRVACETDISPKEQRLYFKEHACVGMPPGSSCRLQTLPMTPTLCFDFCRQHKEKLFFGIEYGRDCYCTGYFHPKSTGGGDCKLPCEGDSKEMCGGPEKSSLFEMHFCDKSAGMLKMVGEMAKKAKDKAEPLKEDVEKIQKNAMELSDSWQLGVCSIEPQGALVCSLNKGWVDMGNEANEAANEVDKAVTVLDKSEETLDEAKKAVEDAGDKVTGEQAGKQDKAVAAVSEAAVSLTSAGDKVDFAIKKLGGPLVKDGKKMDDFKEHFEALGDKENGWQAVCALEPIGGQSYVGLEGGTESCAHKCFSLVTGTDACVGFNYQSNGALKACQLLTEKGLTKPEGALSTSVPIFEISDTKRGDMKLTDIDCYVKKAFMGSHPEGPLKTQVVKQVTVDF